MNIEAFISTLRLPRILGIEKFSISKRDINAAAKADLDKLTKSALQNEEESCFESHIDSPDLPKIKEQLYNLDLATLLPEIMPKITEAGAGLDVAGRIIEILNYLKSELPQSEYELTGLGLQKTLEASRSSNARFLWKCRLADNPYHILDLFTKLMLTKLDVEALQAMYPDLYMSMAESFIKNVTEIYPSDTAIPRTVKHSLSVFLGLPIITLEQLNAYNVSKDMDKPQKTAATGTPPRIAEMEQEK